MHFPIELQPRTFSDLCSVIQSINFNGTSVTFLYHAKLQEIDPKKIVGDWKCEVDDELRPVQFTLALVKLPHIVA